MEYQEIINFLYNEITQTSKFRTKSLVETNDDAHETNNGNSEIKFKTVILKSILCDCSDT